MVFCLLVQASLVGAPLLAYARFQNSTGMGGVVRIFEMPCEPPLISMHHQRPSDTRQHTHALTHAGVIARGHAGA